ncbi:MAG: hypothetical protein [Thorarchaeia virus VerdaV2]|uniref:Uncharacterized protein n=1 Tax=Thorarchaeia virus VerdaV2 TaxID=3070171 RepID=A0AA35G7C0_9CAUD|nr:MAG: hypothetical protein QIT42_gp07 [Thorarchaeia virus VerdaV2]BDI54901.1 MAG: hypothetical protein [Thorarchaeia virus VerdaV2]
MTNETELNECSAQIKLVKRLISQPETFELDKVLIELETRKKLLIKFMPMTYATIRQGLESGTLVLEEKGEKAEAEKLKAAAIKAEKIAAKKAELAALEAEEVD